MHPILFEVGGRAVHTYGVLLGLGLFGGLTLGVVMGKRQGLPASWMWDLGILIVVSSIVGARLEYVRLRWPTFAADPRRIADLADGGLVFYGGLIGAVLACSAYAKWRGMDVRTMLDSYAAAIPLGHALGRVGCFAAGCCYGLPSDLPWAVTFPPGSRAPAGVPLHPVQLYEAVFNTILGVTLLVLPTMAPGRRMGLMMMSYPLFRAFNETMRGDSIRGTLFGLSTAQATSVVLFAFGLFLWFRAPGTARSAPAAR